MMNQTILQTTKKLINLLPANKQYYGLDDLRAWGFPSFIVQRMQVELERNMAESMIPPKTDWANTESDTVQNAWQQFVQAIREETRLPASHAKGVIETAVADTLDMLIEPRKNIPDIIFGSDEKLDYEQLCDRVKAVVVYRHFAVLVPRYMQRKELDTLSRSRCSQLIRRVDERMTENYSPLNWAQTLNPLFTLLDGQIEPSMLRLYFEDKERDRIAKIFDQKDEPLNRAEFIEILSSPDWDEHEAASVQSEPERAREEPVKPAELINSDFGVSSEDTPSEEDEKKGFNRENVVGTEQHNEERPPEPADVEQDEELDEKQKFIREQGLPEKDTSQSADTGEPSASGSEPAFDGDDDSSSLNAAFGWDDEYSPPDDGDDEEGEEEEDEYGGFFEERNLGETKEEERIESPPQEEELSDTEGEERPIWMNFMSEGEENAFFDSEEDPEADPITDPGDEKSYPETDEDVYRDRPIAEYADEGVYDSGDDVTGEAKTLKNQLREGRERFIEDIFSGSERSYEEAVETIAASSNWREASNYIQNEIFKRNLVDMYTESAIEFTDRLHNYFSTKLD